jgi:hypothetical protein
MPAWNISLQNRQNTDESRSPSALARWMRRLVATPAIAGVSIMGTQIWETTRPLPTAPLTAGLMGEWSKASAEMDQRVKAMFPIGSSVALWESSLNGKGSVELIGAPLQTKSTAP